MTPGFHIGISAEKYHADCCPQPSLSNGIAKLLLRESAKKAWFNHPKLNPAYKPEEDEKFDLGTCAHGVLLENDASKIEVIDPNNYPAKNGNVPDGWTNKAIRAARDAARTLGKTPLLKTVYGDVRNMVDEALAFIEDSEIAEWWHDADSEVTGIWTEGKIWLRCRFDRITKNRNVIFDYKTTENATPERFSLQITRMDYCLQEAFYRRGARALGVTAPRFVFLAQSIEPPYECSLHGCDPAMQEIADAEVERAIGIWRECMTKNQWPSYGGRIHWAMPTSWMMQQHEIRLQEAA